MYTSLPIISAQSDDAEHRVLAVKVRRLVTSKARPRPMFSNYPASCTPSPDTPQSPSPGSPTPFQLPQSPLHVLQPPLRPMYSNPFSHLLLPPFPHYLPPFPHISRHSLSITSVVLNPVVPESVLGLRTEVTPSVLRHSRKGSNASGRSMLLFACLIFHYSRFYYYV